MRILIYAPNYLPAVRYGGPIRSSHGLARALVALGHEVHVFTTNLDGPGLVDAPIGRIVTLDGVSVRYFPVEFPRRIYFSPAMARAIETEIGAFDVAHTNGVFLWPGPQLARQATRANVPVIASPRGMLTPEMIAGKSQLVKLAWIRILERRALSSAAAIHVTSEDEADGVRRMGLDVAPLRVIGNGVDIPDRLPEPGAIEAAWAGIPSGARVLFLGRLDWTKGVDLAIEAVRRQAAAQIVVAGHDQIGLRQKLEPVLSGAGRPLGRFAGEVEGDRKWALLCGADVLLAPSLKESFGIAVAEALAVGTPVVCSEGVGAAEILRRIAPSLVVPRTSDAYAGALSRLLRDAEHRAAVGVVARRIMAEEYTWGAIARAMTDLYDDVRVQSAGGAA